VIVEDMGPEIMRYLVNLVKVWADRYSFTGEVKNGSIHVWPGDYYLRVTSNSPIDLCVDPAFYPDVRVPWISRSILKVNRDIFWQFINITRPVAALYNNQRSLVTHRLKEIALVMCNNLWVRKSSMTSRNPSYSRSNTSHHCLTLIRARTRQWRTDRVKVRGERGKGGTTVMCKMVYRRIRGDRSEMMGVGDGKRDTVRSAPICKHVRLHLLNDDELCHNSGESHPFGGKSWDVWQ
jgi:hypothetical protein